MATKIHLKHTKSSATTATTQGVTIPRLPSSGDLLHGEIAINYRGGYETLAIKNSSNQIVPITTNNHQINATKPEGLINGQIGVDSTDVESFYIYNEQRNTWQPVSTNHVEDESALSGIPTVQDPQIAYVKSTGLVYISQYDDTTSAQTWSALATLNPDSNRLADSQEPKVIIDSFTTDPIFAVTAPNVLVFDVDAKKLKQYGRMISQDGIMAPELLYTYDPSKNVIYYNKGTKSAYYWTGTVMTPILEGHTISTDNTMSAVTGNNTVAISSTVISAITPANTIVNKMTPAGSANSNDHSSYSFIFGADNAVNWASGATTFGANNTIASGAHNSFVEGCGNTVSGGVSHAEGSATTAAGALSHSEGNGTYAGGLNSHAEGYQTSALGESSHAEGVKTAASGLASHAEGNGTKASAIYSHAEGYQTSATGAYSHAEGNSTNASGIRSHAEGYNNTASGENSHVGGRLSLAAGRDSFAHGYANSAYCAMSVAMGSGNIVGEPGDANSAVAASSVALGRSNSAMGYSSFACGHYNYTNGMYTNAIGESTSALNVASHSEGFLSTASAMASHAEGAILPTRLGLYESDSTNYDAIVEHPARDFTAYTGNFLLVNDGLYSISEAIFSPTLPYLGTRIPIQCMVSISTHEKMELSLMG